MFGKNCKKQMLTQILAVILVMVLATLAIPVTETSAAETVSVKKIEGNYDYDYEFEDEIDDVDNFSEGMALVSKNYKYGYIDQNGEEVIPCQYDDAWSFSEGMAKVRKNGKYGYINQNGEKVIPCRYDDAGSFSEGLAWVKKNGKYGYINQSGEDVIACRYDDAWSFSEGLAMVLNVRYGYINQNGEEVIPCQYEAASGFSDGLAMVSKDGKYGYINQSGEEVIPCQYDNASSFSEGLAMVMDLTKWECGYINQNGEEVIACQYDNAWSFSGGSALAQKGDQWYLLTLNGNDSDNDNTDSLQAPTVKMDLVNITQTKLTWNKVSHASGYYIYRATSQDGNYEKLADLSSAKTSYIDTTCKQGDTYYYKVIAYNASGTQMTSDIQSKKIPVVETDYSIAAPTISSVEKSGKNIVIRWEKITKGNGYVIYRSTDNKNFNVYKVINGLGTTQLTDKNVKSGKKYFYRIATYYGDAAKQSPISPTYVINTNKLNDDSFKTTLLSVTKKANYKGAVSIKWKKLSNASGYIIYRKEGNGKYKSLYVINNKSKRAIVDVNLSKGKTYTYYIKPFKLVDSNGVKIKYLGSASNKISIKE